MADTKPYESSDEDAENNELDSFRDLTQKLLKVPKSEVDALRKSLESKEPKQP